jgi:hypothetical protein
MKQLVKFTGILLVIIAALLLTLLVAGVFDSSELWDNAATILKFVLIGFGASALIMLIAKK